MADAAGRHRRGRGALRRRAARALRGNQRPFGLADRRGPRLAEFLPEDAGNRWRSRYRGQTQKWFLLRFEGDDAEIDIRHPGGGAHKPEFDAWRWEAFARLPELVVPFKRAVYEKVVAQFGPLAKPA
jgi:hypothetical protein